MASPESIKILLGSVVDYAGLFPPAKLDMASTVRNYARYLQSDESWMLGRLIVPVARLEEFEREFADVLNEKPSPSGRGLGEGVYGVVPLPQGEGSSEPWQISALTAAASDVNQLESDLARIEQFNERYDERAVIDVVELKTETAAAIDGALDRIPEDLFAYFELPIERDPRGLISALADAEAGAKVRTGGVTADAYPSPEQLARFITACAAADVPFKATAGLHHPLRHYSDAVKTKEFGFLNVFMAGCLIMSHDVDEATLRRVLEEESIESFSFSDTGASWRNLRLTLDDIQSARESFAVSFGSCSFDEPVEDLRHLKLL